MKPHEVFSAGKERAAAFYEAAKRTWSSFKDQVRPHLPDASERDVIQTAGDALVDKTHKDLETAQEDGVFSDEEREQITHDDVEPALLAGTEQHHDGLPIENNAITQLEEAGDQELVTDAIQDLAEADTEAAEEAARITSQAEQFILDKDKSGSPERTDNTETARRLEARTKECEQVYTDSLRQQFSELLRSDVSEAEQEYIKSHYEIAEAFNVAQRSFAGERVDSEANYEGTAETLQQSRELRAAAERADPQFQADMQRVAEDCDALYVRGPVKTIDRIAEKTTKDNGGAIERMKDAVRCRFIIVDSPLDDQPIIDEIRAKYPVTRNEASQKEEIKRSYVRNGSYLPISEQNRYMDTKVTVNLHDDATDSSIRGEIVIATPEMAAATKAEHPVYEIIRSLDPTRSSLERSIDRKLRKLSRSFYASVSNDIAQRLIAERH